MRSIVLTFSCSSFLAASSLAILSSSSFLFFSSSRLAALPFAWGPFCARLAARAAFSCSLNCLIRGSRPSALSTRLRTRALSSFLRRARSLRFFFSV